MRQASLISHDVTLSLDTMTEKSKDMNYLLDLSNLEFINPNKGLSSSPKNSD